MARNLARNDKARDRALNLCRRQVKRRYKKWPSARASQALCKCRKAKGYPCKGRALRRWRDEKWVDTRTGKPCGSAKGREYCRPTRRVSARTPTTVAEASPAKVKKMERRKGRRPPLVARSGSRRRASRPAKARRAS